MPRVAGRCLEEGAESALKPPHIRKMMHASGTLDHAIAGSQRVMSLERRQAKDSRTRATALHIPT